MARQRLIKPEFFQHEELYRAEQSTVSAPGKHGASTGLALPLRLAFVGLWTQADRRGLFAWKPSQLKLNILPYDTCDFSHVLDVLESFDFVRSYEVEGRKYGLIPTFAKHQSFHNKEAVSSTIPEPPASTVQGPVKPRAKPVRARGKPGASPTVTVTVTGTGTDAVNTLPADAEADHGNWVAELVELWEAKVGPLEHGRAGRQAKKLVKAHGWPTVKAALVAYLEATEIRWVRLDQFVARGTYWVEQAKLAKLPAVDPATRMVRPGI